MADYSVGDEGSDRARRGVSHATGQNPIHIKPSREGSLHAALGVPQDQKIPVSDLKKAEQSSSEPLRKKAQFADNARGFNH